MMATARQSRKPVEEEAVLPQTPPPASHGFGHGLDVGFVWQQLTEIQKSLGAIQATQVQHTDAIGKLDEKLSGKLSKIDGDVSEFKQIRHTAKVVAWIVGVALAGGLTVVGFVAKEVWSVVIKPRMTADYQIPKPPSIPSPAVQPPTTTAPGAGTSPAN